MLTGSGKYLENLVKDTLGIKVRSVELNVSQRCSSSCLSGTDLEEAVCAGSYGVDCAMDGKTGVMITLKDRLGIPTRWFQGLLMSIRSAMKRKLFLRLDHCRWIRCYRIVPELCPSADSGTGGQCLRKTACHISSIENKRKCTICTTSVFTFIFCSFFVF